MTKIEATYVERVQSVNLPICCRIRVPHLKEVRLFNYKYIFWSIGNWGPCFRCDQIPAINETARQPFDLYDGKKYYISKTGHSIIKCENGINI